MAHELVTLESPDGRRYRTDSPTEINLLVGSYGYARVADTSSKKTGKPATPQATTPKQNPPEADTPQ